MKPRYLNFGNCTRYYFYSINTFELTLDSYDANSYYCSLCV